MGILRNNTHVIGIFKMDVPIIRVYRRGYLVWEAGLNYLDDQTLSCFSNQYWIDEYPWNDNAPWAD